jgi:hypothetical protein
VHIETPETPETLETPETRGPPGAPVVLKHAERHKRYNTINAIRDSHAADPHIADYIRQAREDHCQDHYRDKDEHRYPQQHQLHNHRGDQAQKNNENQEAPKGKTCILPARYLKQQFVSHFSSPFAPFAPLLDFPVTNGRFFPIANRKLQIENCYIVLILI